MISLQLKPWAGEGSKAINAFQQKELPLGSCARPEKWCLGTGPWAFFDKQVSTSRQKNFLQEIPNASGIPHRTLPQRTQMNTEASRVAHTMLFLVWGIWRQVGSAIWTSCTYQNGSRAPLAPFGFILLTATWASTKTGVNVDLRNPKVTCIREAKAHPSWSGADGIRPSQSAKEDVRERRVPLFDFAWFVESKSKPPALYLERDRDQTLPFRLSGRSVPS